jgi:hypothetical protein
VRSQVCLIHWTTASIVLFAGQSRLSMLGSIPVSLAFPNTVRAGPYIIYSYLQAFSSANIS